MKATLGKLLVVKYGGSVLDSGPAIRRAAEAVKQELDKGTRIVVVASAMKGVTDQLLSAAETISTDTPPEVVDRIIGLGEEQSVRLVASALRSLGADAVEVTPDSPGWPIVTDEKFGDAEPMLEECESSAELGLRPLIERGKVPVVCGFVGRSLEGYVTTLGRGGSDTTAVILAACLGADELVLVKDVDGVYTADPKKVEGARPIATLSAWEADLLASTGAKVLHDKVLRYKPEELKIRIVSTSQSLNGSGTVISGTIPELEVEVYEKPVLKVIILGGVVSDPEALACVSKAIEEGGGRLLALEGDGRSTTLFVDGSLSEVLNGIHSLVDAAGYVRAVSGIGDFALIGVRGRRLDDPLGATRRILDVLSANGIDVRDIITNQSSVSLLLDWDRRDEFTRLIKKAFEET